MSEKNVGTLAKFTGVSVHTIKYYEKIGLFTSKRNEKSNYRSYDVRVCTVIGECVKYKNMGFTLKEIDQLCKSADDMLITSMLQKRLDAIDEEIRQMTAVRDSVSDYCSEIQEAEEKLGEWYIEKCPDLYIRVQTNNLEYRDEKIEVDGVNLASYAPRNKSTLIVEKDSMNGGALKFHWGQGIVMNGGENEFSGNPNFLHVQGKKAFVAYMRLTGSYCTNGEVAERFAEAYHQYHEGEIPSDAYAMRIKITYADNQEKWNYFKLIIPIE
ncbi:MAG: MerR family transcriptional regulator [Hespellia sp.]|nr:MerR family transcriptional regulator [Hespellia sp.]